MTCLARRSLAIAALVSLAACADGGLPSSPSGIGPGGTLVTVVDVSVGIDVTAGYTGTTNWAGQSFTVPPGSGYRAPRFNWYSLQKEPVAFGQLYVLTEEYLGLPGELGSSTAASSRARSASKPVSTHSGLMSRSTAPRAIGSTRTRRATSPAASTPTSIPAATCT
jgi:hypothetical protein